MKVKGYNMNSDHKFGKIKFYSNEKKYGFIRTSDIDRDIFFHWNDVSKGIQEYNLVKNCNVRFLLHEVANGFEAKAVEIMDMDDSDLLKGIKMWEMYDDEGNIVKFKNKDDIGQIRSINLSKDMCLIFYIKDTLMRDEDGETVVPAIWAKIVEKEANFKQK